MKWRNFGEKVALLTIGALISTVASLVYGLITESDRTLTYRIESHDNLIDDPAFGNLNTTVDGRSVKALVFHQIRLWNTGDESVHDIHGSVDFGEAGEQFKIFSSAHEAGGRSTFEVVQDDSVSTRRNFSYPFLNSGEEVVITLTTNAFLDFTVDFRARYGSEGGCALQARQHRVFYEEPTERVGRISDIARWLYGIRAREDRSVH